MVLLAVLKSTNSYRMSSGTTSSLKETDGTTSSLSDTVLVVLFPVSKSVLVVLVAVLGSTSSPSTASSSTMPFRILIVLLAVLNSTYSIASSITSTLGDTSGTSSSTKQCYLP